MRRFAVRCFTMFANSAVVPTPLKNWQRCILYYISWNFFYTQGGGGNRSAVIKFTILQSSQRTLATSFFLPAFRWNGYLWCLRTNIASFRCMRKASLCEKVAIFGWDRNSATPERLLLNIMYCLLPSSTFWAGRLAGRLVCSKAVRQSYNINLTLLVPQNGVFPTPF